MAERITSRANPLMVHIRKLASSRAYRYETGEYLGDGVKLLEEAVRWGAALTAVVHTPGTALPPLSERVRVVETPPDVMRSISPMEAPQGVLFLAQIPALKPPQALPQGRYLALEGVQDPGNVGTILRTADAFEADGLLLLPGCADLYNHKTVRSSMGAIFRLPVWSCTLEGGGLSGVALDAGGQTVRIPMAERCESLNVAAAAAALLWEGYRREAKIEAKMPSLRGGMEGGSHGTA